MSNTITRTNELIAKLNKDSAPQEPTPEGPRTTTPMFSWQVDPLEIVPNKFEIAANGLAVARTSTLENAQRLVDMLNKGYAYDTLAAQVAELETEKASLERSCEASINAALDLSAQVAHLEKALREFGQHKETCDLRVYYEDVIRTKLDCDCGFDAALGESK